MRPRWMGDLVEALAPILEQALVVVLGAAVAGISAAVRRYMVAKHLESTVNTAINMVRAADPGATPEKMGEDVAGAVAAWLTAHGHSVSASSARRLIAAVARQARHDEEAPGKTAA